MKNVRSSIDRIDDKILPLMVRRSKLVNNALELKLKKNEIIDKKRISQILKKIESKSKKMKANPKLIKSIWMSMIQNFIDYEEKEFIVNKGIDDRVEVISSISDDELANLYSESEAVIHTSLYEGFGIPALEALATGTPVVGSQTGAIAEIIGPCGLTVEPGNPQAEG